MFKKVPPIRNPSSGIKKEEKNKKAVQSLPGERNIRDDNLCMTYQDVIGDAAKPRGGVTDPRLELFQSALLRLTQKNHGICSFNYSDSIRNFITAQTVNLINMGTIKEKQRELMRIPFGQQTPSGQTFIPLVVSINPREVIIDFNVDNVAISPLMIQNYATANPTLTRAGAIQGLKSQIKEKDGKILIIKRSNVIII